MHRTNQIPKFQCVRHSNIISYSYSTFQLTVANHSAAIKLSAIYNNSIPYYTAIKTRPYGVSMIIAVAWILEPLTNDATTEKFE